MKFRLIDVKYPGDLNNEELIIEALEEGDLGYVLIIKGTAVTFDIKSCVWLPNRRVSKGTRIHVRTSKTSYGNTNTVKYISLERDKALWSELSEYEIILIECKDWSFGYFLK